MSGEESATPNIVPFEPKTGPRFLGRGRRASAAPSNELFNPERPPWWFDPLVSWLVDIQAELDTRDAVHLRVWTMRASP